MQRLKRVHAQFHPAEQGDGNPASTAADRVQNPRTPGLTMSTLELSQHPELAEIADQLRKGLVVVFTDHGTLLGVAQPTPRDRGAWLADLAAFRASLHVTPGKNAVLDMRAEDDR